jgi:hypothetical protein
MAKQFYAQANCMGYAFNKNKWMIPHGWDHDTSEAINFIKTHFKHKAKFYKMYQISEGVRMTKELPLGKTFVVYRQNSYGDDFHFVKRLPTGHWRHKMGNRKIQPIAQKWVAQRVWSTNSFLNYDNPFYVFELL